MSGAIKDQGMMWVTSRIAQSAKSILDEGTFMRWYDEDHIAEIVQTSGIPDAFRYVNVKKESPLGSEAARKPFLAIYPMQAMEFTQGEEFKKIRVKSDILPGSSVIYDLADIDVEYLGLVSTSGGEAKKGKWQDPTAEIALLTAIVEHAQYILSSATEPASGISDNDVNRFYDQQTKTMSNTPNYIRSLRFKLLFARTNAQSRALKGLPTTNEPSPEPPTWRCVHEFSSEPSAEVQSNLASDQSDYLKSAKQNEVEVYRLAGVFGTGKFFE